MIRFYRLLKSNKKLFVYLPLIIYWITLLVLTTLPKVPFPKVFKFFDKVEHFIAYAILAFLLSLALHFQKKYIHFSKQFILYAFVFCAGYGILDEIHQLFIPGRYFDMLDWAADLAGTGLGLFFSYLIIRKNYKLIEENGTN